MQRTEGHELDTNVIGSPGADPKSTGGTGILPSEEAAMTERPKRVSEKRRRRERLGGRNKEEEGGALSFGERGEREILYERIFQFD